MKRLTPPIGELTAALEDILQRDLDGKRQRYADAMRSASSHLSGGGREAAQPVLRMQIPGPGEDDPREFAWDHLWAEAARDYTFLSLAEPSSILPDPSRWAERIRRGQALAPRLSEFAEWIRINPSGLKVHDYAGSYFLDAGRDLRLARAGREGGLVSTTRAASSSRGCAAVPSSRPTDKRSSSR